MNRRLIPASLQPWIASLVFIALLAAGVVILAGCTNHEREYQDALQAYNDEVAKLRTLEAERATAASNLGARRKQLVQEFSSQNDALEAKIKTLDGMPDDERRAMATQLQQQSADDQAAFDAKTKELSAEADAAVAELNRKIVEQQDNVARAQRLREEANTKR